MRTNKIDNMDLFTQSANIYYRKHIKTRSKQALEILKDQIDWNQLVEPIVSELKKRRKARSGRRRFDLKVIVRCFILQSIYGLSDPRLEEEIADRRSFQLFLELTSGDSIPDETTICRYRELFSSLGLDKALFENFNDQLRSLGLLLEKGTLVDATLKTAQARSTSRRDPDARHTRRKNKIVYGYKGHIGMDTENNFIHSVEFTPADVHDSTLFESLIHENEEIILADKGYASQKRKRRLREKGIYCGILDKAYRNRPLSKKQKRRNKRLSSPRSAVERPFAFFKRIIEYDRCSYYDLRRNRFEFVFASVVYNMRRYITVAGSTA